MAVNDEYARAVMRAGIDAGISPRGIVIAFATVFVESNWVMYANQGDPESLNFPHQALSRDANSVGLFQQRAPWWGDVADRMDPYRSAALFFAQLKRYDYNNPANSPGFYAQQVQRSAFPNRYDERMPDAQALYDRLNGSVKAAPKVSGPKYTELDYMTGGGCQDRGGRKPINFLLHTQEADASAEDLARYCDGSNNVSYHYTLRDGILCDVVDTDMACWAVLDANPFTISLCFAGSFAGWTREQWLEREEDIAIAAEVAVADCRKYGIPLDVIAPPYGKPRPGISDHNYVTVALGIGNHSDVGKSFPWDVFAAYVQKWSGESLADEPSTEGGVVSALTPAEQRELLDLLRTLAKIRFPSRSPLRHLGEGPIDTVAGIDMSTDGNVHVLVVKALAEAGVQSQIDLLNEVANADPVQYPDRQQDAQLARQILANLPKAKKSA